MFINEAGGLVSVQEALEALGGAPDTEPHCISRQPDGSWAPKEMLPQVVLVDSGIPADPC